MSVYIRAQSVEDCGNGIFVLHFEERYLTDAERETIAKLYPNLTERAYDLLAQEQLVESLAQPEEVRKAKETRNGMPVAKVAKKTPTY